MLFGIFWNTKVNDRTGYQAKPEAYRRASETYITEKSNKFIKFGIENDIDIKIKTNLSHGVLSSTSVTPLANASDIVELHMLPAVFTRIEGWSGEMQWHISSIWE